MADPIIHSDHIADLPDNWKATVDTAALPDGRQKKGIRLHRANSVHIIAKTSDGKILLLREFRPFLGKYIWMLPGGKADKETGYAEAALRELREETGYGAKTIRPLWELFLTDTLSFTHHVFVAEDLFEDPLSHDDDELMEVHAFPLDEAIEKVLSCQPAHVISAAALLRYAREY